jgi:branched-chain amino acid transport system ATP-binding protein
MSQYAHVIDLGRTILSGTGQDLISDPRVQAAYLGTGIT